MAGVDQMNRRLKTVGVGGLVLGVFEVIENQQIMLARIMNF